MNPYLRINQESHLRNTYPYSLGILNSSWPELEIDLSDPPKITAKVLYERAINLETGVIDCRIELYVNGEPLRVSISASKRVSLNSQFQAGWVSNGRPPIPQSQLPELTQPQLVPFDLAAGEAFREWIPDTPSADDTKAFLLGPQQEWLFRNYWIHLAPPSLQPPRGRGRGPGRDRPYIGYISLVHWFDGKTYFVVSDIHELFTDARSTILAAYKQLVTRAGRLKAPVGETLDDMEYLETQIDDLTQLSGGGNVPLV